MRSVLRIASGIAAATLAAIAVTPAMAAAPISQAGANAITVSLGGEKQGSGNVTAKNDGSGETKTGETDPADLGASGTVDFSSGGVSRRKRLRRRRRSLRRLRRPRRCRRHGRATSVGPSAWPPATEVNATMSSLDLSASCRGGPGLSPRTELNGPLQTPWLAPLTDAIDEASCSNSGAVRRDLGLVAGFERDLGTMHRRHPGRQRVGATSSTPASGRVCRGRT